jgi:3-hydroxybutyryl-CoA dehydrogenase
MEVYLLQSERVLINKIKDLNMEKLAIIGCGTMGHSIALSAAWAGLQVRMYGTNESDAEQGKKGLMMKLNVLARHEILSEQELAFVMERIFITTSMDEVLEDCTFVIEAVPENIDLKKNLFLHLDKVLNKDVILASNTSALSPTAIASGAEHAERILVTHFWNPAHLVPLVEIVRGEMTNDESVKRALDLLRFMKKKPIEVKKEVPGFVANRLQFALFREAQYLLENGIASKEDIDAAVVYSIGRRLSVTGPLVSADMGGLDVFDAISDYLFPALSNAQGSSPALKELVANNKLGSKTGEGYYVWDDSFLEKMNDSREAELIRFMKQEAGNSI